MMTNEFASEILETPGRVTMLNEDNALVRTISLTRKTHSTDQDPGFVGDSIGHWEGKTLVVETTNLNDRSSHIPGVVSKGGTVKITERYHLEQGGKVLFNDMTFENPAVLTKPWTIRYAYHRGEPRRSALGVRLRGRCARLVGTVRGRSRIQASGAARK